MTFVAPQPAGAFRSSSSIAAVVCLAVSPAADLTGCVAQVPPAATTQPSWTRPVDLEGLPANHAIRWPILTSLHDTVYVAANIYPVPMSQGRPVGERPIYLARLPGGAMPAPPWHFQFIYPKILKAPNGDLHMVWAERDSLVTHALGWPGPLADDGQMTLPNSVLWISPRPIGGVQQHRDSNCLTLVVCLQSSCCERDVDNKLS